jgi:hypothetical protein
MHISTTAVIARKQTGTREQRKIDDPRSGVALSAVPTAVAQATSTDYRAIPSISAFSSITS